MTGPVQSGASTTSLALLTRIGTAMAPTSPAHRRQDLRHQQANHPGCVQGLRRERPGPVVQLDPRPPVGRHRRRRQERHGPVRGQHAPRRGQVRGHEQRRGGDVRGRPRRRRGRGQLRGRRHGHEPGERAARRQSTRRTAGPAGAISAPSSTSLRRAWGSRARGSGAIMPRPP